METGWEKTTTNLLRTVHEIMRNLDVTPGDTGDRMGITIVDKRHIIMVGKKPL